MHIARTKADGPSESVAGATGHPSTRRPTRSVFWRIFLWYWLAMLLLVAAVVGTVFITDPDEFFPRQLSVPLQRLDQLAAANVEIYERAGPAALRASLANMPPAPATENRARRERQERGYLVDLKTGRELSGLRLPTDTSELVRRAKSSTDLQMERLFTEVVIARPVNGARSGHRYVFLLVRPRSGFLLPTTPQVWLQLAAALMTSAAVCYWLARSVVKPVRRLQAAARRLAGATLERGWVPVRRCAGTTNFRNWPWISTTWPPGSKFFSRLNGG